VLIQSPKDGKTQVTGAQDTYDDAPFTLWDGINRQYRAPMENEFEWIRKKFGDGKFSQSGQASRPKARAMPLLSGSRRIVTNSDSGLCTLVSYGRQADTWVVRLHMFVGEYISQSRTDRESNHLLSLPTWLLLVNSGRRLFSSAVFEWRLHKAMIIAWVDKMLSKAIEASPLTTPILRRDVSLRNWEKDFRRRQILSSESNDSPLTEGCPFDINVPDSSQLVRPAWYQG
jgi:hypothetical protein